MSAATGTAGTTGAIIGKGAGAAFGRIIGGIFGGPIGAWVGGAVGARAGALAGQLAAEALADYMEDTNEAAEEETEDRAASVPCEDCGEIDCFNPPEDPEKYDEFKRQLKEQQDTLNGMDSDELLSNMDYYAKYGRPKGDAKARRQARDDYRKSRTRDLEQQYRADGLNDFVERAAKKVAEEMANLNATHAVDLVAGGDGAISGLGDATVNKSLGSQWKGRRAQQLREHAKNAQEQGKKMNVELEECPDDSEVGTSGGSSDNGAGASDPGNSGPVPIS